MKKFLAITFLLIISLAANAADYELPTNARWPHGKLTPVGSTKVLCSTWADPLECKGVRLGKRYTLHLWVPDWSRTYREDVTMNERNTTNSGSGSDRETIALLRIRIGKLEADRARDKKVIGELAVLYQNCKAGRN